MTRVRKRDGSLADYDEGKVAHEILLAARDSGEGDPAFATELAEVVSFFIEKHHGTTHAETVVDPAQIADMIERVLLETAPPPVAKAFILRRQRRDDAGITVHRAAAAGQKSLFPDDQLTVQADTRAEAGEWEKARIVAALVRECDIAPQVAAQIADRVEERLFNSGLRRVTTGLIRELIDVELFNNGLNAHREQQAVIGIPRYDLEAAILRGRAGDELPPFRDPGDLDRFVTESVLQRYTLSDTHSPAIADAHVEGRLHLHGLAQPLRLHSLRVCPEGIKQGWPTPRSSSATDARARDRIATPATEEQFFALLRRYAEELLELVTDGVTFTHFSLVLAPLAARLDADGRRALVRRAVGALSGRHAARLTLEFPLEVPAGLQRARVAALGGSVSDGVVLGDLTPVVRDLAREAVLLLLDGTHQALLAPDIVLALDNESLNSAPAVELLDLATDCASRHGAPRFRFARLQRKAPGSRNLFDEPLQRHEIAAVAVSLNLPQAAFRAGRGNHDGFAAECDRLLGLAHTAVTERWQLLVSGLARLAHPLLAVGRDTPGGLHPATIDLRDAHARLAVTGLAEAMAWLASSAPPDATTDAEPPTRGGLRAISYLSFALREQASHTPIDLRLAEGCDVEVARRFRRIDARTRPDHVRTVAARMPIADDTWTPGIALPGSPDPLSCLTREARFHTMLDAGAEIVVPAACPTHSPQLLVETIRHAVWRTGAHGMAFPAMAVSCPACGDSRATPLAIPAVCPTCGHRPPDYGWLVGNRFTPVQPAAMPGGE